MNIPTMAFTTVLSFTLLCFVPVSMATDQCVPLKGGPFEACSIAGYNHTFPIPRDLSPRAKERIKRAVFYLTRMVRNCSVASIAETMSCSYMAPYCKAGQAILPCRRVCSEFLKRCESAFPPIVVDFLVSLCTLLENGTSSQGKCYEPPDFHNYHNTSSQGPLERKCGSIIFPFCKNLAYSLTTIPRERQISLYKIFYGKNYTDTEDATRPAPKSRLQSLINSMRKYSSCAQDIKKVFCADNIPPCFKDEGLAFYTVCKNVCIGIEEKCPGFLESHFGYYVYCGRMATGNATENHGYCRHTSWPPPMKWLDFVKDRPVYPHKLEKGGIGAGLIVVIVLVPLVIAGTTIGLVYYCKTRRLSSKGYSRQEDDKADLVT